MQLLDLNDDCLAMVLNQLGVVNRLKYENVCQRFRKCLFRELDEIKIFIITGFYHVRFDDEEVHFKGKFAICHAEERLNYFSQEFFDMTKMVKVLRKFEHRFDGIFLKLQSCNLPTHPNVNNNSNFENETREWIEVMKSLSFPKMSLRVETDDLMVIQRLVNSFKSKRLSRLEIKWFTDGSVRGEVFQATLRNVVEQIENLRHLKAISFCDLFFKLCLNNCNFNLNSQVLPVLVVHRSNYHVEFKKEESSVDKLLVQSLFKQYKNGVRRLNVFCSVGQYNVNELLSQIANFTKLRSLTIKDTFDNEPIEAFDDKQDMFESFNNLATHCQLLRVLITDFDFYSTQQSADGYIAIMKALSLFSNLVIVEVKFRVLQVGDVQSDYRQQLKLTYESLAGCKKLRNLSIAFDPHWGLHQRVTIELPYLWENFDSNLPSTVKDLSIRTNVDILSNLTNTNFLTKISLWFANFDCKLLKQIVKKNTQLNHLVAVARNGNVKASLISYLIKVANARKHHHLDVVFVVSRMEIAMERFGKLPPNLKLAVRCRNRFPIKSGLKAWVCRIISKIESMLFG